MHVIIMTQQNKSSATALRGTGLVNGGAVVLRCDGAFFHTDRCNRFFRMNRPGQPSHSNSGAVKCFNARILNTNTRQFVAPKL